MKYVAPILIALFSLSGCTPKTPTESQADQNIDSQPIQNIDSQYEQELKNVPEGASQPIEAKDAHDVQNASRDGVKTDVQADEENTDNSTVVADSANNYEENTSGHDLLFKDGLGEITIDYCREGNCPCGNGFCSKGSHCINDLCVCGDLNGDEPGFDSYTIVSNHYGEFECYPIYTEEYYEGPEEGCPGEDYYHRPYVVTKRNFICTREEGCKTGDGKVYPKSADVNKIGSYSFYSAHDYSNNKIEEIAPAYNGSKFSDLAKRLQSKGISEICGKNVPGMNIADCEERIEYANSGIKREHLSEYE